jgi:hypothetical protein
MLAKRRSVGKVWIDGADPQAVAGVGRVHVFPNRPADQLDGFEDRHKSKIP